MTGDVDQVLQRPAGDPTCSVLVLSGSSGRVERDRARLLADHGAVALSIQWFGGPGQPPGICEVALETFAPALHRLAAEHEHLAVLGTSKGAEAALLLATSDPRIRAVAAIAPSSVVWANVGPGLDGETSPYRSSWTSDDEPLPFVPYDDAWEPSGDPPAYRGLYVQSLETFAGEARAATIPVERIAAEVLVVAGEDDQLWPSPLFAEQIAQRRARAGLATRYVLGPGAGHRVRLPGEPPATGGAAMARGGSEAADAALGERAWGELRAMLGLG